MEWYVFGLLSEGRDGFHTVPNKARAHRDLSLIDSAYADQPCPQSGRHFDTLSAVRQTRALRLTASP